jgi:hypothetical protein
VVHGWVVIGCIEEILLFCLILLVTDVLDYREVEGHGGCSRWLWQVILVLCIGLSVVGLDEEIEGAGEEVLVVELLSMSWWLTTL